MQFANSQALSWLLALIPCALVLIGYFVWKRRLKASLGHAPMISAMMSEVSITRQIASGIASLLGIALLIVALLQPQWGQADQLVSRSGIDVVFALDLSRSMLAQDVAPSRLDAAKKEISTTLKQLAGDRAGLVVFTSVSFAQSPLTSDYGALRFYLRKLKPGQMPMGGTSVGRAIFDGVDLLIGNDEKREDGSPTMKRAKNQIIVLITDGEDHESDPMAAARQAHDENIHIVTVGLGSAKGERIPTYNQDGSISGYQRNRKGELVYSKLDASTLKKIASETGGVYIPYKGENSVAYALVDYINALEKSELEAMMKQHYKERFFLFLIPGILLLLVGFLLGDRRRPRAKRVGAGGDGEVTKYLLTSLILCAPLFTGCEEVLMREVESVKQANSLIEKGKPEDALKLYDEASETLPPLPELSYNKGRAQMELDSEVALAQEAFAKALETDDPHLRFDALYNLGLALAKQEKWKDAYETFQQALMIYATNPEWQASAKYQDAVVNMEVAWQKLFPPCATLEDDSEENDSPEQATALEEMKVEDRTLCGGDDDFYVIPVVPGSRVTIKATFEDLREVLDPERVFLPRQEDLQLVLTDRSGQRIIAVDQGVRDDGDKSANITSFTSKLGRRSRVKRQVLDLVVAPEMLGEGSSEMLLKLKAGDEREFKYAFDVEVIPPCLALEDQFEPNNTQSQAKPLEATANSLHFCPGGDDWFTFDVAQGDHLFVDLQTQQDMELERPPVLAFEVRDARGKVVKTGEADGGFLTAQLWQADAEQRYFVRVFDPSKEGVEQGPYALSLYHYGACPESNDRYEDNNDPQSATQLDPQIQSHRYLRICPNDRDFFTVTLPEPKQQSNPAAPQPAPTQGNQADVKKRNLSMALTPVVSPIPKESELKEVANDVPPDAELQPRPLAFVVLDPSNGALLAQGKPEEVAPSEDATNTTANGGEPEQQEPALPGKLILNHELEAEQALLGVQGPELFYHLDSMNPSGGQQNQDDQQQDSDDQQDSENQDDQQQEQQDDGSGEDENKEQEQQDDGDGKDGQEEEQEEQEKKDGEQDQPSDEKSEEEEQNPSNQPPEQMEEAKRMQRVEDILRALEDNDDNFQMRKALENAPGRYIEKNW